MDFYDVQLEDTSDGWIVTGYTDSDVYELEIPACVDGRPVIQIESDAFSGLKALNTVWIPYTVTHIEGHAFSNCPNLTAVISDSLDLQLASHAFSRCKNLERFRTEGTIAIGPMAFHSCFNLTEFKGLIDVLHKRGFDLCDKLAQPLYFANHVYNFDATALQNCRHINELHFSGDVDKVVGLNDDLISRLRFFCTQNSNLVNLAYSGANVIIEGS